MGMMMSGPFHGHMHWIKKVLAKLFYKSNSGFIAEIQFCAFNKSHCQIDRKVLLKTLIIK
jgi:hypothetical protein